VQQQVPQPHAGRVRNDLVNRQPDNGVVGADNRTGADADHDVDRNPRGDEPPQHAQMTGATEAAGAEDQTEAWPAHVVILACGSVQRWAERPGIPGAVAN
jgi:hypothetical protein